MWTIILLRDPLQKLKKTAMKQFNLPNVNKFFKMSAKTEELKLMEENQWWDWAFQ
jgi:hypothetical protein